MTLSSSMEDYLEAVLVLRKQSGYARCVDVAAYLQVTKPSVSRAVKELIKAKYLCKDSSGILALTSQGEQVAYMSVTASSQKNCLQRVLILKRQKRKHAGWNMVSVKHLSIS